MRKVVNEPIFDLDDRRVELDFELCHVSKHDV